MSRLFLLFLMIFTLFGCGHDQGEGGPVEEAAAITRSSMVGEWRYTYPATQCAEVYKFSEPDYVYIESLDEKITGRYSVENEDYNTNKYKLRIQVYSDNELTDCHGSNENNASGVLEVYVEYKSEEELLIYSGRYDEDPIQIWVISPEV